MVNTTVDMIDQVNNVCEIPRGMRYRPSEHYAGFTHYERCS
ncbi:uncharacterized protein G2W53_026727 [Senna tora]|uniref:Uncharacterized protein n=1 Tax=Senna tora TaxID=362788 RepID=A0A834WFX6_9FABA|nr:uncharacterized protein G2W53_026727 [Senna tora]